MMLSPLYSVQEGRGDYPPDAPEATEPSGFSGHALRNFSWDDKTPIGGRWDWERAATRSDKVHGCYAGVSIIDPGRTSTQMLEIDKKIDDGDLATGKLRQHSTGYIYIIEE